MSRPPRSFTQALVVNVAGWVFVLVALLLVAMAWQAVLSTREAAQQEVEAALDRSVERLRILIAAAEMTVDSAVRAASTSGLGGANLRPVLEHALAAFEQRPELSYLGLVLPRHGEYGNLERTGRGEILLWLLPGARPQDRVTRNFVLTDRGFVAHEQRPTDGYDPRVRPFYRAAQTLPAGGGWIPAYRWILHFEGEDAPPLWGFSYVRPLRDRAGALVAVLDADFDLPALNRFLSEIAADYGVHLQIVELGETPRLVGDRKAARAPLPLPDELRPLLAASAGGAAGAGSLRLDGEPRWVAARRMALTGGLTWVVIASRDDALIDAPLRGQLYQVAGMGVVTVLALALIALRLARRFGRPLAELERSVAAVEHRGVDASSAELPAVPPAAREFRETELLGEALGRMTRAIRVREQALAASAAQLLQAKEEQLASLALKGAIFDTTDLAIVSLAPDLVVVEWNAAAERLFGVAREAVLGRSVHEGIAAVDGPADWPTLLATEGVGLTSLRGAGGPFEAELRVVVQQQEGRMLRTVVLHDVSARRRTEQRLRYLATHDELTDLPNRKLLQDRLEQAIGEAGHTTGGLALIFLDLDRFKVVNDAHGHLFGDAVLKAVGRRLLTLVREGDTVARHGGDEFLVLLTDLQAQADAESVARKITACLRLPLFVQGREIHLTGSVGMSVHPQDGTTAQALIANADLAMYRAKSLGRNMYQGFTREMGRESLERVHLETGLRGAADAGQLHLVYQPKVSLASGAIIGCEALLRWRHPELGLVPPGRFIPIAEDAGLIAPLSDWVLRTACRQARDWSAAGLPALAVAVNISARQILQQDVAAWVLEVLAETGLPAERLELELTESLIAQDVDKVTTTFGRLKDAGVKLSIDDFGTGYSSLAYLQHFPVDTLKIDQSFVRNMLAGPGDATIVRAVITLAHHLAFKVIAEGVETEGQCRLLRQLQCDEIQGFVFSRPVPAEAFEALVREGRRLIA